ncbi:MAG: hypothetical protein DRP45_09610 [Candidatus Zixiibacteriota bacterium]|nr:MAG: hypothetical protein DRP45_09610 [candidate division Zixibacteria bacterium]
MTRFSILTPVYCTKANKRLSFLKRAIESVKDQNLDDYEHYILDDGSTIDLEAYIRSLDDEHITYRRTEHLYHKDPVTQWDVMLRESKGDYKLVLGSDDALNPGALRELGKFLDRHPSYVAVTGKVRWHDEDGTVHPHYAQEFPINAGDLISWNKVHCCATLFRDSVFREVWKPDKKAGFCVDWDIWLKLNEKGPIGCIDDTVLDYYRHSDTFEKYTKQDKAYRVTCEADVKVAALVRRGIMDDPNKLHYPPVIGGSRAIGPDVIGGLLLKSAPVTFLAFVKNEADYFLDRMLNSLLPYVPKLVVVDTGSTDGTMEMLAKYSKEYNNLVFFQHKCSEKQIYKAINEGIARCESDWIFIVAGDEAMLPSDLNMVPGAIEEAEAKDARIVRVSYLDFIGDDKHYHTKYPCVAHRIWRNDNGFHFGGDFQGDIYMAYDDGVQTGGVETQKNLPPELIHERLDIYFHHYARCKPKDVLLEKRKMYYRRRLKKPTIKNVNEAAKNCPFYTLDLPLEEYTGPQAGLNPDKPIKTIGFYTKDHSWDHFAQPILKQLRELGYNVITCYDLDKLDLLYDKCDVLWVEWAEDYLLQILSSPRKCKVVVRCHRYEIGKSHIDRVNWGNADLLVFVNRDVRAEFMKKCPKAFVRTAVVPNAVDCEQIRFQDRQKFGKEILMYSLRFGDVKDYPTAIRVMEQLPKTYHMTIRAMPPPSPDDLILQANGVNVDFITSPIDLDTIDDKTDVNELFKGKDMLLSTSKYESFGYNIAEALLGGLQAFVRGWDRGGNPEDFWANWVCDTEQDMIDEIQKWSRKPAERKRKLLLKNRQYVEDRFGKEVITDQFLDAINGPDEPHVVVIVPTYNNEHFMEKCLNSLLMQTYGRVTVLVVNDASTDRTPDILVPYLGNVVVITNYENRGAHESMSIGLQFAKYLGADYTIFAGSDDIYNPDYIEKMVEKAESDNATLVYPNFTLVNAVGIETSKYRSQEPNTTVLKKDCFVCDHSLFSSEFWDWYGWKLRVTEFKAYSVFHAIMSNFVQFKKRQRWVDEYLWQYRLHNNNLHKGKKQERAGQRQKVINDIFGGPSV